MADQPEEYGGIEEDTLARESRHSRFNVQTAEVDTIRSTAVLGDWRRAFENFKALYEKNGFGEDIVKIMKSPARRTAA